MTRPRPTHPRVIRRFSRRPGAARYTDHAGRGLALAAAALVLAACRGSGGITVVAMQRSVAGVFGNLYARQQALLGRPGTTAADAQATVSCARFGAPGGDSAGGPGDDWRCTVIWLDAGVSTRATYDVSVRPTGCYSAEGPTAVVGPQELPTPTGGTAVNPLAGFDGCLDLS